ncbi:MAG: SDR family oxidoreductase [Planctomycetes bacterium]|nr:SDR family oxidoreductase [Planctomycetota bacterium]
MSLEIDCSGKIALVTGASGNLGGTMAKTLAQAGADIALHYFSNPQPVEKIKLEIEALGQKACLVQGDVSKSDDIKTMKETINKELGSVDILVLNAVSQIFPWKTVLEETEERFVNQFNSCSLQALHMCQAFVPDMCKRGWGRVIGISTECIMQLEATQSAYVSAKRGSDGLLRVLASEVGEQGVTVNQVAPGWIDTGEEHDDKDYDKAYIEKHSVMGRRASDQDVANTVTYLASDLARSMTGSWIPVSCGSVQPRV